MRITSGEMILVIGIVLVFHAGLWLLTRAACRIYQLTKRTQIIVATAVCLLPTVAWVVAGIDRLDAHERTCLAETLKTARMAKARDVKVERHNNYWAATVYYRGIGVIRSGKPYIEPKVQLDIVYRLDNEWRLASILCIFTKVPNSGNPPAIAFQSAAFTSDMKRIEPW